MGVVVSVWDRPDLEPDRDPETGEMVPCVWCGMSPQVGGTGCCSPACEAEMDGWYAATEEGANGPL